MLPHTLLFGLLTQAVACQQINSYVAGESVLSEQVPLAPPEPGYDHHSKHDLDSPLFKLHRELVEIESITNNEHAVGQYLVKYLRNEGLHVETQHVADQTSNYRDDYSDSDANRAARRKKGRFNVYAYPKHRNASIVLSSHIDTVPPYYPYRVTHANGSTILHGRGAVDAKASVAAQATALLSLLHHSRISPGDAALLFVVGEEVAGDGMRAASDSLGITPAALILGEPTENRLCAGHKGMLSGTLAVRGRAAHSGYPWLGLSANELLVAALAALLQGASRFPASDKFGPTTLNVGLVQGGVASNVVAETAHAAISVRLGGGTVTEAVELFETIVSDAMSPIIREAKRRGVDVGNVGFNVTYKPNKYPPQNFGTDIEGFEDPITVNYGTDAPQWDGSGVKYLYGPGSIFVAHSDHEALLADDLVQAVEDYEKLVLQILKNLKNRS